MLLNEFILKNFFKSIQNYMLKEEAILRLGEQLVG